MPGPGKGAVIFRAMTACDCGCDRPARFEFRVGDQAVSIADPAAIRDLIAEMQAGYELIWPEPAAEPAAPTRAVLRASHGTPEEFERAVWEAYSNLFCTRDEALAAIGRYREDYAAAAD